MWGWIRWKEAGEIFVFTQWLLPFLSCRNLMRSSRSRDVELLSIEYISVFFLTMSCAFDPIPLSLAHMHYRIC